MAFSSFVVCLPLHCLRNARPPMLFTSNLFLDFKTSLLLPFEIKWHLVQKRLFRTSQVHLILVFEFPLALSFLCVWSMLELGSNWAHHLLTSHQLFHISHRLVTPSHEKFTGVLKSKKDFMLVDRFIEFQTNKVIIKIMTYNLVI